jgi:opacity protein-like surface antigen
VKNRARLGCTIAFCLFLSTLALAQTPPTPTEPNPPNSAPHDHHSDPVPVVRKPVFVGRGVSVRVSAGYVFVSLGMPSSGRVNLSGPAATVTADLSPRFGASVDLSYARASNVLDTGRHADDLSYLAGPVFYPLRTGKLATYIHALGGGARVSGVIPQSGGDYEMGYANKLSWAVGAGVEYQISTSVSFRGGGDYQHTYFFDSDAVIRGQNDVRALCSVVYTLWQHPERRR